VDQGPQHINIHHKEANLSSHCAYQHDCDNRFAKKRSWKLFFLFFSHSVVAFWEFGIWGKSFTSRAVEFLWLGACNGAGSCRVGKLGRESWFSPLTSPNPSRPPPNPPPLCSRPPIPLPLWPPPPSHLLLSQALAATHLTLAAAPPSPPPKVSFVAARIYVVWCKSSTVFGGGRKGGRKGGEPKVIFVFICCSFVLQSNCLDVAYAIG
jgi:hypothetical protein